MSFSRVMTEGLEKVYKEDIASQTYYMTKIMSELRLREEIAPLLKAQAFFVPNNGYIEKFFGSQAQNMDYDLYVIGECVWQNFLVFPIYNVADNIVGLAGWDVMKKSMGDDSSAALLPKYRYSRSMVFNRGNYIYFLPGYFERAVKEGYVILTDGIFDMLYLSHEDFVVGSLLGSFLTDAVIFMLRFIDTLFVAYDNDEAGRELYEELKAKHPNVKMLRQNSTKDVDDILKSEHKEEYVRRVRHAVTEKVDMTFRIKPDFARFRNYVSV